MTTFPKWFTPWQGAKVLARGQWAGLSGAKARSRDIGCRDSREGGYATEANEENEARKGQIPEAE
jgi:hypothetical protein